jgi:methyl-accepting chemotaxis protein-1 (serine sensor receptor)
MHRHAIGSDDANDNHGATRIMKMPTMKIGTRMMSGFIAVIALMLIVGVFAQTTMRELANTADQLYLHPFTVSTAVLRIDGNIARIHGAMRDAASAASDSEAQAATTAIDSYESQILDDFKRVEERFLGDKSRVLEARQLMLDWKALRDRAIAGARADAGVMSTLGDANSEAGQHLAKIRTAMDYLVDFALNKAQVFMDNVHHTRDAAIRASLVLIGIAMVAAVVLAWRITRSVTVPLQQALTVALKVAAGQLDNRIDSGRQDETGQLLAALKAMNERLLQVVDEVRTGSETVSTAANEIAHGNDDLSQRTQRQASTLEETAASMEEMSATVNQNADNARKARELAASTRDQAEQGGHVVTEAVAAMREINASSKRIAEIIGVIDEIAFQTNLLALNAAVEAARAGEQGRGFAVVASEVRALAQRSADAAKEIKTLIHDSDDRVRNGSALVDQSGQALLQIVESVRVVTGIVTEIAAASQEQADGIAQVNKAVIQLDELTQHNAALVEEASAASRTMEEQAHGLVRSIAFFKNDSGQSDAATPVTTRAQAQRIGNVARLAS